MDRPVPPDQHRAAVRVIASPGNWIDGSAVQQLEKTASWPGMVLAVGLPDLHPGKGTPIGAAFLTRDWIYPTLVGNDIGCGIGLWRTSLSPNKRKLEAWAGKLRGLESTWDDDAAGWLQKRGVAATGHEAALGTIGGGNHFAELQVVERIEQPEACAEIGLDSGQVALLVHSGSRGLGETILREHVEQHGMGGLSAESDAAKYYLQRHEQARRWAAANRELIALRLLDQLNAEAAPVLDVCHNWVEPQGNAWLHRKGAAPSTAGPVVIPGSRGTFSYLVRPLAPSDRSAFSLAHGAGRKWARTDSKARLEKRYSAKDLARTELGSYVICEDKDLLYEEAPPAYKNITVVIEDLVKAELIEVLAVLRPVITYKVRK